MALKPCPHCGNRISDKATKCPKCGAELSEEDFSINVNSQTEEETPLESFDYDDEPKPGNKRWLWIALPIIIVAAVVVSILYLSNEEKINDALMIDEQARQDSLMAVQKEAERLEQQRQDSIARRNFVTPDLALNDLHGDVQKCEINNAYYLTFDENGKWTNEPTWGDYDKEYCPERTKHPKVIRDKNGYIIRMYFECEFAYESEDITWKDNKVWKRFLSTYTYNDDGYAIGREDEEEYDYQISAVYCNYEIDGMGNWVKRDAVLKYTDIYDNTVRYNKETETRTITYYNSNPGNNTIQIPNNAKQQEALNKLNGNDAGYSSASSSSGGSVYSSDEGRTAYLEVLRLQQEVKTLINQSSQYRRIMNSEEYMSGRWQAANLKNKEYLGEAIQKQQRAISIAESELHDQQLLRELNGQLDALRQYY